MHTHTPDLLNSLFELLGGFMILLSIRRLIRDRIARGFHWGTTLFFSCWGYWNLFYYPALEQWYSAIGALGLAVTNTVYLALLWHYRWPKPGVRKIGTMHYGPITAQKVTTGTINAPTFPPMSLIGLCSSCYKPKDERFHNPITGSCLGDFR